MKVACAVVIRDDKILIQKRLRQGRFVFEFPMGKVEENESFEEAAMRELREETGLNSSFVEIEVLVSNNNDEIAFVVLEISQNSIPLSDKHRKQKYFWFHWNEIPLDDFHNTDKKYILSKLS
jgi:8-oxo-dGTP diphosphatase